MLKWNKLLLNDGDAVTFDERIEPTTLQRDFLDACRIKIREHVREGVRRASVETLGLDREVSPRFRLQGSWSYRTCVQRAHSTQEMDLDYGIYLPVRVFEDRSPRLAARAYFDLVERLLDSLCKAEGWKLDTSKDTCIRVKVAPWAHIDVPLYAAPEHIFHTIQERTALSSDHAAFREAFELSEAFWAEMEGIHLARRDGTWKPSDPAAVTRWWRDLVDEHGEQLRRICRYIKAWRDHWWPEGGPSSVALMVAIARDFGLRPRRDDLALEAAAQHLSTALLGTLHEPGIDGGEEDFLKGLDAGQKREAADRAGQLAARLNLARHLGPHLRGEVIAEVRGQLGSRIPDRPDWVEVDGGADVRAVTAAIVPPPAVAATESG